MSSARLPPSLLRQHATRFTQGAITLEDYRAKRAQILANILAMHAPVASQDVPSLFGDINFGSIRKSRSGQPPLSPSRIVLLSVLSFTAALMSLLPNARTTITAISSTLALTAPAVVSARQESQPQPSNSFQDFATTLAEQKTWQSTDIDKLLQLWTKLNEEQRYSARRYTGYNQLLSSAAARAAEFRELAEVSTLRESLEAKANEVERISNALLNQ